jgi:hypothetical protein
MSWIRENKTPAAIIGVSAAGAIALGVMLFNTYSSYSTSLESFDSLNSNIARMKGAPLAPTPQNLEAKRALVADYTASVNKLALVVLRLQNAAAPITNTEFQAKLKSKIAAIRKLATDHSVALPPEFNLAFDRYNAELPKSNEVATELSSYLDGIYALVELLIESGVNRIEVLDRSDLPSEKDAPAAPANTAAKAGNKKGAARPGAAPAAPVKATERYQVRVVAMADQGPLQVLIGKLASPSETPKMPYFPIVRVLRIENERQEGPVVQSGTPAPPPAPPPPQPEAAPSGTAAPAGAPAQPVAVAAVTPAPPDSVMVLGGEKLKVFMEIDLVRFLTAPSAAAAR